MNHTLEYEDPVRPIYEYQAIAGWVGSGLAALGSGLVAPFAAPLLGPFAGLCAGMALWRSMKARALVEQQRALEQGALAYMTHEELAAVTMGRPDELFIGYGFPWTQAETQLCDTLMRNNPERLLPRDPKQMGQHWIHGIGRPREEPIFIPHAHNGLMTLIAGTTGAGKSRLFDLLITQIIHKNECVIAIDPKNDYELRENMRAATIAHRGADQFLAFSPAFPEDSARIDCLRSFNRVTELATRIASLISSETGSDPFVAFSQMALNNVCSAVLMIEKRPSLVLLRSLFEGGYDNLLVRAFETYFDKTFRSRERWYGAARPYVESAREGNKKRATSVDQLTALAYISYYRAEVMAKHPSSELEGIISNYEHDSTHFSKMVTSLMPVLNMLTAGTLGPLLSPDYNNPDDPRPITNFASMIRGRKVVYIALDALSDSMVASAMGALFLADLASVAGQRYNDRNLSIPVSLFVDESSEVVNIPMWQMASKARGANFAMYSATQSLADYEARLGSRARAAQFIGNMNQVYALRLMDTDTQTYMTEAMGETIVRRINYAQMTRGDDDNPLRFSASVTESLKEEQVPLVSPDMMGRLPNLEFFARISAGRIVKCRIPILQRSPQPKAA